MVLLSDEESENDSISSERARVVDAVQQFQHEMVSSDEASDNDSTPSPAQVDAVQQKSGNERKYSHLMIASMISWLSKQSMVIAIILVMVRMLLFRNSAVD
jgi:hypothetical protein